MLFFLNTDSSAHEFRKARVLFCTTDYLTVIGQCNDLSCLYSNVGLGCQNAHNLSKWRYTLLAVFKNRCKFIAKNTAVPLNAP